MKKLIVLLLALVVVGGVFAQATVNGYVRTIGTMTENTFTWADRVRLNLGWTSEDKNVVFKARLQSTGIATNAPTYAYAYGSVMFMDGMLKVTAGKLDNYDYNLSCGFSGYKLGNTVNDSWALSPAYAMMLQAYPMAGLNIGVYAVPVGTKFEVKNLGFGVNYALEGIGNVIVEGKFSDPMDKSRLSASFNYTGVENLGVAVGYKGLSTVGAFAIVNYTMGDLAIQLSPEMKLKDSNVSTSKDAIYFEGQVKYTMGSIQLIGLGAYETETLYMGGSKYLFGGEFIYNVGKGQLQASLYYDEVAKWSIPLVVKVSF